MQTANINAGKLIAVRRKLKMSPETVALEAMCPLVVVNGLEEETLVTIDKLALERIVEALGLGSIDAVLNK